MLGSVRLSDEGLEGHAGPDTTGTQLETFRSFFSPMESQSFHYTPQGELLHTDTAERVLISTSSWALKWQDAGRANAPRPWSSFPACSPRNIPRYTQGTQLTHLVLSRNREPQEYSRNTRNQGGTSFSYSAIFLGL